VPAEPAPVAEAPSPSEAAPAPTRRRRSAKAVAPIAPEPVTADGGEPVAEVETEGADEGEGGSPRRGWWQRTFGA
jgi:ribonuclease E